MDRVRTVAGNSTTVVVVDAGLVAAAVVAVIRYASTEPTERPRAVTDGLDSTSLRGDLVLLT